jgi:hypothetical protein
VCTVENWWICQTQAGSGALLGLHCNAYASGGKDAPE